MSFDPDAAAPPGSGIFGLDVPEAAARVVLLPVPFEATVSYGAGASGGPAAILRASHQVDLFDYETGRPYEAGIFMRPIPEEILALNRAARADAERVIEAGGVAADADLEAARRRVEEAGDRVNAFTYHAARDLLQAGKIVGVVGGDHSVPFGAIRAHAEHYGELGILHLDAHADLRAAYEGFIWSHASIMERVLSRVPSVTRLVQVGIRDVGEREIETIRGSAGRVSTLFDPDIVRARLRGRLIEAFERAVAELPEHVYLSFDIDGLDPRLCPGTGTPVPGGLDLGEASVLLEAVVASGRTIVGLDLCEVSPSAPDDDWDGNVGARLLYKMIGWTLKSRRAAP